MESEPTVFVVDDDPAICESLANLLESRGLRFRTYPSAEAFLAAYDPREPGCAVLDVRLRGMSGLELQARLARDGNSLPVIILTGHGDIPMAVRAAKAGAVDFLEKPVNDEVLLQRIHLALAQERRTRSDRGWDHEVTARVASLTPREREVMDLIVAGLPNKQVAIRLNITEKTVEVHRRRVLQKMGVHSAVDLVRLVLGHQPAPNDPAAD
jgi:FixJ family two-component response regulator